MIKNYIKIAWRNLLSNKLFSSINIFGLAIGLAACLLLSLYISDELSYDSHHKDLDRLYRLYMNTLGIELATSSAPMASTLMSEFPEIESSTRILRYPNVEQFLIKDASNPEIQSYEENVYYADSTFFDLFSYEFINGNLTNGFGAPNTVVISKAFAEKTFGNENPINKVLTVEMPFVVEDYTIKGVIDNEYTKSHIPINILLSMKNEDVGGWVESQENLLPNNLFHSYIKLHEGASKSDLEAKFIEFTDRHMGESLAELKMERTYKLQPVKDIYLNSQMRWEVAKNGNIQYIYIFSAIAIFILIIACINFMNLSTAKSEKRGKEVGMRKVLGANKSTLILQFLAESLILSIISLILAIALVFLTLPIFNGFTSKQLSVFGSPNILISIAVLGLFTGLISGAYPAFYLSSFKPIRVLKGKLVNTFSARTIRKGLVVFQFAISTVLIVMGSIIWNQLDYIQNQDLGFNKEQQLVISLKNQTTSDNYEALRSELLSLSGVKSAAGGDVIPGQKITSDNTFYSAENPDKYDAYTKFGSVEYGYVETLGYELAAGRSFSEELISDSTSILLNEIAINELGYDNSEDAIGKQIYAEWDNTRYFYTIIGVLKNFNFDSLHEPIGAYGLFANTEDENRYIIANLDSEGIDQTLAQIEQRWSSVNPNATLEYSFLDQDFAKSYKSEQQASTVIFCFMVIAIFIACIGLFGLVAFVTEQRKKEVGVRRVLGASILGITAMHMKDFMKLIAIAVIIAFPLAYYLGEKWLEGFAYKFEITPSIFIQTALLTLLIALLTIGGRTLRSALSNPSENLRAE
ncbi:MAG: ABC transporter permease [Flavobacteriales bacterium]